MLHPVMQWIVNTFIPPKQWHQSSAHVNYGGLDWLVHYDFQPSEKQERDYPGAPAEVQITEVFSCNGRDPVNLKPFFDEGILSEIEELVLKQMGSYEHQAANRIPPCLCVIRLDASTAPSLCA